MCARMNNIKPGSETLISLILTAKKIWGVIYAPRTLTF